MIYIINIMYLQNILVHQKHLKIGSDLITYIRQVKAYTFGGKSRLKFCPILPDLMWLKLNIGSLYLYVVRISICIMVCFSLFMCLFM